MRHCRQMADSAGKLILEHLGVMRVASFGALIVMVARRGGLKRL